MRVSVLLGLVVSLLLITAELFAQDPRENGALPIAAQWVLDAAGPIQRTSIASVFLMYCPTTQMKGTSFLLKTGLIVTNNHVVRGCTADNLMALSSTGKAVKFTKFVTDPERDLALLRPSERLDGGLELAAGGDPSLGTAVSTFGYPLRYSTPPPILSVGYVAGYRAVNVDSAGTEAITGRSTKMVKHIIVNGAFNPGNSGGPIFVSNSNKVVGIVVWKQRILSQVLPVAIDGFRHPSVSMSGTFSKKMPDGTVKGITDQEVLAEALEDIYNDIQVMIGEAISVSELKALLGAHSTDLN